MNGTTTAIARRKRREGISVFGIAFPFPLLVLGVAWSALALAPAYAQDVKTPLGAPAAGGWRMVWNDEFVGSAPDPKKWDYDLGNGYYNYEANMWITGWGNDERQFYTKAPENVFVKDGFLHLKALKESVVQGFGFTSARIKSKSRDGRALFAQKYGRFEFRAKMPTGQGIWPALWLLPQDEAYGPWAASGEIDIVETRGQRPQNVVGSLHYGGRWPTNKFVAKEYPLPRSGTTADFHVYALEWEPGVIRWSADGVTYATERFWWSSGKTKDGRAALPQTEKDLHPWPAPFDQPFHIVMNVAVGGRFAGDPDVKTPFPAEMLVDYVRVYEKTGGYGPTPPRGPGNLPDHSR